MQLAQINIARMLGPLGSPVMKEFEDNLDPVNALAEKSPGFVWRYQDENNNATTVKVFDDDFILVNMSVWEDLEALFNFVYKSNHVEFFKRRAQWFDKMPEMHMVLWYVEDHTFPTIEEALDRLLYLRKHGETPFAFSFRQRYTPRDLMGYQIK